MSFSRWGWQGSDVYTFPTGDDVWECCGCHRMVDVASFRTTSLNAFLDHLDMHRSHGDTVPDGTYDAARAWAEQFPDGWGHDCFEAALAELCDGSCGDPDPHRVHSEPAP